MLTIKFTLTLLSKNDPECSLRFGNSCSAPDYEFLGIVNRTNINGFDTYIYI